MKNAENNNGMRNMMSYNTSSKAMMYGTARKAVSGTLARFWKNIADLAIWKPVEGITLKLTVLSKNQLELLAS